LHSRHFQGVFSIPRACKQPQQLKLALVFILAHPMHIQRPGNARSIDSIGAFVSRARTSAVQRIVEQFLHVSAPRALSKVMQFMQSQPGFSRVSSASGEAKNGAATATGGAATTDGGGGLGREEEEEEEEERGDGGAAAAAPARVTRSARKSTPMVV
jgi:hypothetical protein